MSKSHTGKYVGQKTRERLSSVLVGRNYEELHGKEKAIEIKNKLSVATTGRTPWNKNKKCPQLSEARLGKRHTKESKIKMSVAKTGANNPMYGQIPHNRKPVQIGKNIYPSIKEAADAHGVITQTIRRWIKLRQREAKLL